MKAYISYSLNESEQYILTILARKLNEYGYSIISGYDNLVMANNFETYIQLDKANLFVGILTDNGNANDRVKYEWQKANELNIPALLLVEDMLLAQNEFLGNYNVLGFNRNNPHVAIETIRTRISVPQSTVTPKPTTKKKDNSAAWILGGVAALIVIGLLANNDD